MIALVNFKERGEGLAIESITFTNYQNENQIPIDTMTKTYLILDIRDDGVGVVADRFNIYKSHPDIILNIIELFNIIIELK